MQASRRELEARGDFFPCRIAMFGVDVQKANNKTYDVTSVKLSKLATGSEVRYRGIEVSVVQGAGSPL